MSLDWLIGMGGTVAILLLLLCWWLLRQLVALRQAVADLSQRERQQAKRLTEVDAQLHELRTGSIGVGDKVKQLGQQLARLEQQQTELAQMEPESKLYSRAVKLLQNGATVDEIMNECELPRAEAELLFNLHGRASAGGQ